MRSSPPTSTRRRPGTRFERGVRWPPHARNHRAKREHGSRALDARSSSRASVSRSRPGTPASHRCRARTLSARLAGACRRVLGRRVGEQLGGVVDVGLEQAENGLEVGRRDSRRATVCSSAATRSCCGSNVARTRARSAAGGEDHETAQSIAATRSSSGSTVARTRSRSPLWRWEGSDEVAEAPIERAKPICYTRWRLGSGLAGSTVGLHSVDELLGQSREPLDAREHYWLPLLLGVARREFELGSQGLAPPARAIAAAPRSQSARGFSFV